MQGLSTGFFLALGLKALLVPLILRHPPPPPPKDLSSCEQECSVLLSSSPPPLQLGKKPFCCCCCCCCCVMLYLAGLTECVCYLFSLSLSHSFFPIIGPNGFVRINLGNSFSSSSSPICFCCAVQPLSLSLFFGKKVKQSCDCADHKPVKEGNINF